MGKTGSTAETLKRKEKSKKQRLKFLEESIIMHGDYESLEERDLNAGLFGMGTEKFMGQEKSFKMGELR